MSQGPAARDDITETTLDPFDQQLRAIYGDHYPGGYLRHQERMAGRQFLAKHYRQRQAKALWGSRAPDRRHRVDRADELPQATTAGAQAGPGGGSSRR